jgi:hypothetical protein
VGVDDHLVLFQPLQLAPHLPVQGLAGPDTSPRSAR